MYEIIAIHFIEAFAENAALIYLNLLPNTKMRQVKIP